MALATFRVQVFSVKRSRHCGRILASLPLAAYSLSLWRVFTTRQATISWTLFPKGTRRVLICVTQALDQSDGPSMALMNVL